MKEKAEKIDELKAFLEENYPAYIVLGIDNDGVAFAGVKGKKKTLVALLNALFDLHPELFLGIIFEKAEPLKKMPMMGGN